MLRKPSGMSLATWAAVALATPTMAEQNAPCLGDAMCELCVDGVALAISEQTNAELQSAGFFRHRGRAPMSEVWRIVLPELQATSIDGTHFAHAECCLSENQDEIARVTVSFRSDTSDSLAALPQSTRPHDRNALFALTDEQFAALPPGRVNFTTLSADALTELNRQNQN